jgi:hypothetical protein
MYSSYESRCSTELWPRGRIEAGIHVRLPNICLCWGLHAVKRVDTDVTSDVTDGHVRHIQSQTWSL